MAEWMTCSRSVLPVRRGCLARQIPADTQVTGRSPGQVGSQEIPRIWNLMSEGESLVELGGLLLPQLDALHDRLH